jgi:GrpB-like predicted nucleotidyltransferase (UPF0157 family)
VIEVVDYDPSWADRFALLRTEYLHVLNVAGVEVIAVEHVGSTAVPGLAAKPVIDVDIVVELAHVRAASEALESLGFQPLGDRGIPGRWAFREPPAFAGTNTYVVARDSLALKNHLRLRDTLRANNQLLQEYATVKRAAAAHAADMLEYVSGKNDVVLRILAAAGLDDAELASIAANQVPSQRASR